MDGAGTLNRNQEMSVTTDRNDDGSENLSPWTSPVAQPEQTPAISPGVTPDDAGTLRELVRVALPLAISSGSLSLMHVVDRMFLTWYSKEALAASLPSGMLNWTLMSLAIGTVGYVNTFVAQYQGARRNDRVAASVWQGVHFAWITGVLLLVFIPLAKPVFTFANHEPLVQQLEVEYFQILIWGSAPTLVATALSCFYSGRGKTMLILYVDLVGNVTNIVLDFWLIFGGLGIAPQGIAGAAWGTVIANVVKLAIYAALVFNGAPNREYGMRDAWRFDRDLFQRLLQFGAPNGIMMFLECVCFTFFMLELGKAGTNALAASNLAFNLNSLVFIPLFGVGTAVSTLVGQRIGEGRPEIAVRSTRLAFALSSVYTGLFAVVYLFQPHVLLAPYQTVENAAEFASMQREVTILLRFVALYSFFDATVSTLR